MIVTPIFYIFFAVVKKNSCIRPCTGQGQVMQGVPLASFCLSTSSTTRSSLKSLSQMFSQWSGLALMFGLVDVKYYTCKKLHGSYTRNLHAVYNTRWRKHPSKHALNVCIEYIFLWNAVVWRLQNTYLDMTRQQESYSRGERQIRNDECDTRI